MNVWCCLLRITHRGSGSPHLTCGEDALDFLCAVDFLCMMVSVLFLLHVCSGRGKGLKSVCAFEVLITLPGTSLCWEPVMCLFGQREQTGTSEDYSEPL